MLPLPVAVAWRDHSLRMDKYEISLAIGELELLPAIRKADPDRLIIANGFVPRTDRAVYESPRPAFREGHPVGDWRPPLAPDMLCFVSY